MSTPMNRNEKESQIGRSTSTSSDCSGRSRASHLVPSTSPVEWDLTREPDQVRSKFQNADWCDGGCGQSHVLRWVERHKGRKNKSYTEFCKRHGFKQNMSESVLESHKNCFKSPASRRRMLLGWRELERVVIGGSRSGVSRSRNIGVNCVRDVQ